MLGLLEQSVVLCKQGVTGSIPVTSTNITCNFNFRRTTLAWTAPDPTARRRGRGISSFLPSFPDQTRIGSRDRSGHCPHSLPSPAPLDLSANKGPRAYREDGAWLPAA